ncbi:MAG: hypothetical protein WEC83_01530 [Patescibacteria group bacterium]
MIYADVLVAKRGSSERLTYAVPASIIPYIRPGCLVTVPVRQKKLSAVVVKIHNRLPSALAGKVREMTALDRSHPGLSPAQMGVVERLAKQYLTNISDILFRALSAPRPLEKNPGAGPGKTVFVQMDWRGRIAYYQARAKKYQETLLLFPTYAHLEDFRRLAGNNDGLIVLDGSAKSRRAIVSAAAGSIFLGTVGDAFFPLRQPGLIIVDQPEHIGSRYSNRPFLKADDIAEARREFEGDSLIVGQSLYSLGQFSKSKQRELVFRATTGPVTILARSGSRELILPTMIEQITAEIEAGQQICVFVASKGWSSGYFCRNCQTVEHCPSCGRVIGASPEGLHCHYCSYRSELPKQCSRCARPDFVPLGEGVDKVHDELRQHFPRATMQIIAGSVKTARPNCQITIATEKILSFPALSFSGLYVISADRALTGSALDDRWRLLSTLLELVARCQKATIQTYLPENRVWAALNPANLRDFFAEELAERKKYSLPPYTQSLKLIGQGTDAALKNQTETLEELIKKVPRVDYVIAETPTRPGQKQWELQLIVPKERYLALIGKLAEILPPNWAAIPG